MNQPHGSNGLKRWLQRKAQGLLGVSALQAQLAREHEESLAVQRDAGRFQAMVADSSQRLAQTYERIAQLIVENHEILIRLATRVETCIAALEQQKARESEAITPRPAADVESLRSVARQGLFIFGCARSGTTILMDSLNRSHEICVLAEPDLSLNENETDFVGSFNRKHIGYGNRRIKGNFLPPPISPENGPLDALLRLARDYHYVGEKTAVGPGDYPINWQQMYLDFHGKYFLRSRYIFIIRRPVESIWSMSKLFPTWPIARLFRAWLQSTSLVLEAYHAFPQSRLVFFEDLGDTMIERLAKWLNVPIPTVPGTFGDNYVRSAVVSDDIPVPLRPFMDLCRECTDLYCDLRASFSTDEYVYRGAASEWAFFDARWRQVAGMLSRLSNRDTIGESALPRAA